MNFGAKLKRFFSEQTDIAGLVCFRILFGGIMFWEVLRYFDHNWINKYWIEPTFLFSYQGFEWVQPWGSNGMYIHFILLGVFSVFICIGFLYRISTIFFFIGFTYIFLLDQTRYLNHFYLICLLGFIQIFLPSNRAFSVDAILWPHLKRSTVPCWTIWWLRVQLGVVYFYGGLAKINGDWLQGEPMHMWLSRRTDFPLIGKWFTEDWMAYLFSYGGLLLDLLAFPLLINKKTRWLAVATLALFHLMNAGLFSIGIFPWFMLAASIIFFPPEKLHFWEKTRENEAKTLSNSEPPRLILLGVGTYLLLQFLIPLRHLFYEGNVNWTEEGHYFSWHMKLRSKTSSASFRIIDIQSGEVTWVDRSQYLTDDQSNTMAKRPIMLLQFARYLAKKENQQGKIVAVKAEVSCSLNGRPRSFLIDPEVDLTKVSYPFYKRADWIMPLEIPLK